MSVHKQLQNHSAFDYDIRVLKYEYVKPHSHLLNEQFLSRFVLRYFICCSLGGANAAY